MVGVAVMDGYWSIGAEERREVRGRETAEAILVGMLTFAVVGGLLKLRSWTRVFMVFLLNWGEYGEELGSGLGDMGGRGLVFGGTGQLGRDN